MRGKKVGLPCGTDLHEYLFYALAAKGLDPINAVTILSIPNPGLPSALQNGSVDAIVTGEPYASQVLQSTSEAIVVQRGGNYFQLVYPYVVSSGSFDKSNRSVPSSSGIFLPFRMP